MKTCPDWSRRVAERDAGREGEGWREALAHLDGCPDCRHRALAADPTLVFRALPRPELAGGEVAAMRQSVAALRRADRVAPASPLARAARPLRRVAAAASRNGRRLRRFAAVATLALASTGLWLALPEESPVPGSAPTAVLPTPESGAPLPAPATWRREKPAFVDDLTTPGEADLFAVGPETMMVFDPTLDV
jgi:hypothetical protein